jgi:hypothetical protein
MAGPAIDGADVVVYRDAAKHSMVAQKSLNGKSERKQEFVCDGHIAELQKTGGLTLNAGGPKIQL